MRSAPLVVPFLLSLVLPALASAERNPALVGRWGLDGSEEVTFELRSDGTGTFDDAPVKWSSTKEKLSLVFDGESESIAYRLDGNGVVLTQDGESLRWQKLGAAPKKGALARAAEKKKAAAGGEEADPLGGLPDDDRAQILAYLKQQGVEVAGNGAGNGGERGAGGRHIAAAPAAPKPSAKQTPQDRQAAQLLVSTAWCSFSFSGGSTYTGGSYGSSSKSRTVMTADGRLTSSSGGETTNSGGNGQYFGASEGGSQGFWKFEQGALWLSNDGATFEPQRTELTFNSNGSPIWKINGTEYMRCD